MGAPVLFWLTALMGACAYGAGLCYHVALAAPSGRRARRCGDVCVAILLTAGVLLVLALTHPAGAAESAPAAAARYRAELTRSARLAWGLDAPIATFAAQVHQESGWNPAAVSRVGARGLAQVMPATTDWLGGLIPDLAARQPENPAWALRALTAYDRWLWERIAADAPCDRMAMVLSAYNGGLGWLLKDKALAQQQGLSRNRWWSATERVNAGRAPAAWAENRAYPVRILHVLEPRYGAWGAGSCA